MFLKYVFKHIKKVAKMFAIWKKVLNFATDSKSERNQGNLIINLNF
jgi:hypothetical protein